MRIKKVFKPGQPGTKRWQEKYGEDLVSVRYRYNEKTRQRLTTIEIIVDQTPWIVNTKRTPKNKLMPVAVDIKELYIRKLIKSAGGKWNIKKKVWELPYGDILALGLENRIIEKEE